MKTILQSFKILLSVTVVMSSGLLYAQQEVTAHKNDTRPEITRQVFSAAIITSLVATPNNGYNEVRWAARGEQDTRKFILEYSTNGIYFQSAGEVVASGGTYLLKHQTFEIMPMLYRLKIEDMSGRYTYSQAILLEGIGVSPVKVYPTIITGNVINLVADFPVERINIISTSGQQVFAQDVGGKSDNITITIPSLGKGMYFLNFTGQGWKATERFIIQ